MIKPQEEADWLLVRGRVTFLRTDTSGSRTTGSFHNNVPKNDLPPLCDDESTLPLGRNYMLCVKLRLWLSSDAPNLRPSPRNSNHSSIGFFSVTPAIKPHRGLAWWNRRTLLNVINSHDRFWTSLHWVHWSREITSGYCEYLMDPGVSINVEKLFIVPSFHVH